MGLESDELAVMAQSGHVHGLTGLRVLDVSILPDCQRTVLKVFSTRGDQLPEA